MWYGFRCVWMWEGEGWLGGGGSARAPARTSRCGEPGRMARRKISLPWFRQGSTPQLTRQHTIDTPSSWLQRQASSQQVLSYHPLSVSPPPPSPDVVLCVTARARCKPLRRAGRGTRTSRGFVYNSLSFLELADELINSSSSGNDSISYGPLESRNPNPPGKQICSILSKPLQ